MSRSRSKSVVKRKSKWGFLCASVGDCKCFRWSKTARTVEDITHGNRQNVSNASDCGGRIGPYLEGDLPDLRNLMTFFSFVEDGDLVLLMSDGVHDNLDPQSLGLRPRDACPSFPEPKEWEELTYEEAEGSKEDYQTKWLQSAINKHFRPVDALEAEGKTREELDAARAMFVSEVHAYILDHCIKTTLSSRDFMESNPSKELPCDYVAYPGKMDHTTLSIFTVGSVSADQKEGILETNRLKKEREQGGKKDESRTLLRAEMEKERDEGKRASARHSLMA